MDLSMHAQCESVRKRTAAPIVVLLSLAYGVVCIETVSLSYLLPFITESLAINNTQIGVLIGTYWAAFAYSAFLASARADRYHRHRTYFWIFLLIFAATSPLSGLVRSFWELLIVRTLMGCVEGPIMPLAQAITSFESSIQNRGMNTGIVLNVGSGLLAGMIAPVCIMSVAEHVGWRAGFFLCAIPGLICALFAIRLLHDPRGVNESSEPSMRTPASGPGLRDLLRSNNVKLCAIGSCLSMAFGIIGSSYLPLYFVNARGLSPLQTGGLIGVLGFSTLFLSFVLMYLADRYGRKPVAVIGSAISVLPSLAAIYYDGPISVLIAILFSCWALTSLISLFMSTIPSESVSAASTSTVIGLIAAISTLVGGSALPMLAGMSADLWGLQAPLLLQGACAAAACILALGLRETLPLRASR